MGIIPGDPAYGFYRNMRNVAGEIRDVPGEVAKELTKIVTPMLQRMEATGAAASKPMTATLSEDQVDELVEVWCRAANTGRGIQ